MSTPSLPAAVATTVTTTTNTVNAVTTSVEEEVWKVVQGFPNYRISSLGKVKNTTTGRVLRPARDTQGYVMICLSRDGVAKRYLVHRLLALYFIPNVNNLPFVDHANQQKADNRLSNLRWCTRGENVRNGKQRKRKRGEDEMVEIPLKGVTRTPSGHWAATITTTDGQQKHLGHFKTCTEARIAYDNAALLLHGEFACTNVMELGLPEVERIEKELTVKFPVFVKKYTSKHRGIYQRENGKWRAYTRKDGKRVCIGTFLTEKAAVEARDTFERVHRIDTSKCPKVIKE
jgi:hypothetical protein